MSFADTVRETHIQDALAASKADRELWSQLREIARVTSARRQSLTEVIHLQAPDPSGDASKGSFLLKIVSVIDATWTTVHQGKTDRLFFYTQDVAMLHLIAQRAGDQTHGATAAYAARVIGIEDTAQGDAH